MIDPRKIPMGANILVETDHDFISREIVKAQRKEGFTEEQSRWVHVETALGGYDSVGATWPQSCVRDLRTAFGNRELRIIYLKAPAFREAPYPWELPLRARVAAWAASRCNLPYGLPALIWWKIRHEFWNRYAGADRRTRGNFLASHRSPFCSQLCGWALRQEGFDPWPGIEDGVLMPAHFAAACGEDGAFEVISL